MSRSRRHKSTGSKSIVTYMEVMSTKCTGEGTGSEAEEVLTLGGLKLLITSEFATVADNFKAVRSEIQRFEAHLGAIDNRLIAIEKGEAHRQRDSSSLESTGIIDKHLKTVQASLKLAEEDLDQ